MAHTERNIISDEINLDYKCQEIIDLKKMGGINTDQEKVTEDNKNNAEIIKDTKLIEEEIAGKKKYLKIIQNEKTHC